MMSILMVLLHNDETWSWKPVLLYGVGQVDDELKYAIAGCRGFGNHSYGLLIAVVVEEEAMMK